MSEEFLTITHPEHSLESELNRRGREGWLVVNCWSSGSGQAMCVLKRRLEYWCAATKSFQPCRSLGLLDLSVALARCQEKRAPAGKTPAIPLEELGAEFGSNQEAVFDQLTAAGLKESPKLPDAHSAFREGFLLFVPRTRTKPVVCGCTSSQSGSHAKVPHRRMPPPSKASSPRQARRLHQTSQHRSRQPSTISSNAVRSNPSREPDGHTASPCPAWRKHSAATHKPSSRSSSRPGCL